MVELTPLSYVNKRFDEFESYLERKVNENNLGKVTIDNEEKYILCLSIGNSSIRARVFKETDSNLLRALNKLRRRAITLVKKNHLDPQWMKIDLVIDVKEIRFEELEKLIAKTRRNYFRYGIAFDPEFRLAFLEQELNGNAMLRSVNKGPIELNNKNINHYLNLHKSNHQFPFMKEQYQNRNVYLFRTKSVFADIESTELLELYNGKLSNGIRKIDNIECEARNLIEKATYFLVDQIIDSGKFEYGYFSAFAKKIGTYNILRHSSSLYSMLEGYELIQNEKMLSAAERGIDYLIREAIVYKKDSEKIAYVVDHANEKEIKLGSNATAILALTKYMVVTKTKKYLDIAQALARGILSMKTPSGGFMHVLKYPTYEIKDLYRIIYYEGEAVFSLLRLYAIDRQDLWLDEVKQSFDYFIENDYWEHHDHWLSYAANEITIYEPEDKYFIFGLKNCNDRLNFIYNRETTYPTFLELTMAAYELVDKIKGLKKGYLLEHIDETLLINTIDHRAEYQRVGFFYPEVAMYMKKPSLILNSFFIRHHSLRVRIDDVEHYLSGYCQYVKHRTLKLPENFYVNLEEVK